MTVIKTLVILWASPTEPPMSHLTETAYDNTDSAAAYAARDAEHKAEKRKAIKEARAERCRADLVSQLERLGG